ncbi:MAG: hypothetical protein Q8907_00060 [Bacteroidota bacterium]|nr:hypothetical protein [Bacteroidota bacterium]MDP4272655.1 hypothetical protein [Bacteroidota bacterium]
MNKKKLLSLVLMMAYATAMAFAAGSFETTLNSMYTQYIRPALIALVFVVFVVTGILKYSDFIKGGEYAKEAFFSCVKMAVYPAFVLGIAEAVKALIV